MTDDPAKRYLETEIANDYTVAHYLRDESARDAASIAEFVRRRFCERYVVPLRRPDVDAKHGFCTMAVSCLMIEALESFRHGWGNTRSKGRQAFCSFFSRNSEFSALRERGGDFYHNVRCGIPHLGETTGGWRIRRRGPLFDASTKTLSATAFHNALTRALGQYVETLSSSEWESAVWRKFRKKMETVRANCADSVFYFAYGSNMKVKRLKNRVKGVKIIGRAQLSGWRLQFDKASIDGSVKANLVPDADGRVWGVVFEISADDLHDLDMIEVGYERKPFNVTLDDCPNTAALAYVSTQLTKEGIPYGWYKKLVVDGAIEHNLPKDYISYLCQFTSEPDTRSELDTPDASGGKV